MLTRYQVRILAVCPICSAYLGEPCWKDRRKARGPEVPNHRLRVRAAIKRANELRLGRHGLPSSASAEVAYNRAAEADATALLMRHAT